MNSKTAKFLNAVTAKQNLPNSRPLKKAWRKIPHTKKAHLRKTLSKGI